MNIFDGWFGYILSVLIVFKFISLLLSPDKVKVEPNPDEELGRALRKVIRLINEH